MSHTDADILTTAEVATLLRVHPTTITRWAQDGHLQSIVLPSGQRRYRRSTIDGMLDRLTAMVAEIDDDTSP